MSVAAVLLFMTNTAVRVFHRWRVRDVNVYMVALDHWCLPGIPCIHLF